MTKHNIIYRYKIDKTTGEFQPMELKLGNGYSIINPQYKLISEQADKRKHNFTFLAHA